MADVGKTLKLACAGGRDKNVFACRDATANFGHKRGYVTVIPSGGLRVERAVWRTAFPCETQVFDGKPRQTLHRVRPVLVAEKISAGWLRERVVAFVKRFLELLAIFLQAVREKRRLVFNHKRVGTEIENC